MNYELAKKLKDAGWPQTEKRGTYTEIGEATPIECYIPTLEELIDACKTNDCTFKLAWHIHHYEGWTAVINKEDGRFVGRGVTPAEAMANLWLVLKQASPVV